MITREKKEQVVSTLKGHFEKADAVFLTNLIGVTSNEAVSIRKKIRDADGAVVVTRNTLFQRASEGTHYHELLTGLKGPHAVAFSFKDAPAVAKALYEAGKDSEVIDLKGGFLGEDSLTMLILSSLQSYLQKTKC